MLIPVILSGGAGTRLWPLSRELFPKQCLALVGERTLLQDTALRVAGMAQAAAPIVVCNEAHRFLAAEQLREVGVKPHTVLLEPVGRNTAPAVAVAALAALADAAPGVEPLLLVLPADHVLTDVAAFQAAVAAALSAARAGALVTFGVVPTAPETGYGYIRRAPGAGPVSRVEEFVEKPDLERARQFVAGGEHLWNSGMFLFGARRYLEELARLAPAMHTACQRAFAAAIRELDFVRLPAVEFAACPADSIDYAVMERTDAAVVVALAAGWSDVGSWSALHAVLPGDAAGNVTRGDVLAEDSSGCLLLATDRLVATVGLTDHVVIETRDAVMVAPRERVQDVKQLVARLRSAGRGEASAHRQVFRPWGSFTSIDNGERFQVKRLVVNPGAVLSLQLHHRRSEHWIVVAGTAKVTRGNEVFLLAENEATDIPVGTVHRVENPGDVPLHIIEVQSGSYFGEDDIVRIEDHYGRQGRTD
ncbi:MAG: mannose-1-phosphate guanylyltransferase/mannose-6-phosphate isomerase [Gammaproteobacteria bacterium]|nr:MAG: mannose-1-phosphate guanylyltransferase/mannose-6-phosphate isomerase [Gammaproteobacteria bacterium]